MQTGVVFNLQRFSIHDGPGIRTTVFLKGCPLKCAWCHNPESRDPDENIFLIADRCIDCKTCEEVCPHGSAEALKHNPAGRDVSSCTLCGECTKACPTEARTMVGRTYTVDELMKELDKDRIFYEESNGGVTFSGGEPLAHKRNTDFLMACLEACKQRGYHRAVDTSGFASQDSVLAVARLTDLFLYDLKLMDDELHLKYVGVSNRPILDNLVALSQAGANVWIRIPLIPGINDDEDNLEATASFVASLDQNYPIHVLPYHKVGSDKYHRLGTDYLLGDLEPPPKEHTSDAAELLRSFGLSVQIGG
jgi:pyruvate formate lyase activating enzyme